MPTARTIYPVNFVGLRGGQLGHLHGKRVDRLDYFRVVCILGGMLIAAFAVIVCLIGLLIYALSANPKVAELGRLAFFAGLLAICIATAERMTRLL